MKLIVNNQTFQAEKIVKSDENIIGYDINNNEIFSFKGISDFTGFVLHDDLDNVIEFPPLEKTELEILQEQSEATIGALNFLVMNSF